jgi:hypothetical protein
MSDTIADHQLVRIIDLVDDPVLIHPDTISPGGDGLLRTGRTGIVGQHLDGCDDPPRHGIGKPRVQYYME